jgi:hypothetical protein
MRVSSLLRAVTFSRVLLGCVAVAILGLVGAGCRPGGEPPEALSAEQIPGAVEEAFQDGQVQDVQQAVREVLAAVEANDDARAYVLLQELLERRDLTPEQRDTSTRAMMSVARRLNSAAASGDESAERVVKVHQANK